MSYRLKGNMRSRSISPSIVQLALLVGGCRSWAAGYCSMSPWKPLLSFRQGGYCVDARHHHLQRKVLCMMNNNYLASLTNPSEDDDDIKDTKPLKGGLASFQSGSYLDNLASSSLSNKGGKDGFSSSSTNRKKKFWSPPKSSAASSYLNALKGSASSVSPWDAASRHRNQPFGSMRPAPWKPDAGQPKFAAVPEPPRRDPMKTSRPAPWKPTAAGRPIVDPVSVPSAPITSREDSSRRPDAAFVPETSTAELRNVDLPSSDIPKNDDVASVVRTDRLDSTRIVYENLVGDILEEEGFIVSAPPVTKQPNAPTSATSRNEPVYLDTMMTQDEVEETLSSSSPPFNTYNTPAWADGPAVWKAESLSTSQPMIAAEPAPTQLTFLDDTVQGQLNAISDEASNDDIQDEKYMRMAIELATSAGGERSFRSAYPNPTVGAVLVAQDGTILGEGCSDYQTNAVRSALENAGLEVSAMTEWVVSWLSSAKLRDKLATSTLFLTLEPSKERRGSSFPPITQLIQQAGIPRVVIGSPDPVSEHRAKGAAALHAAGIKVSFGMEEECRELIRDYAEMANSKFQRMARKHYELFGRPLGFLHCSVVDSDNVEAFARQGNAFGKSFGGNTLSYRNFGSFELAPPPDMIWADEGTGAEEEDAMVAVEFDENEEYQADAMAGSPVMPWYEQADAVVATFPRQGNGPPDDDSIAGRLTGLKWLATHGCSLPAGVERILVLDATDLKDLPLSNDDPNLPQNFDIEAFWKGNNRKPTRVILRRGENEAAEAEAKAAAAAAKKAAKAAALAAAAIETGDAARAAEAAIACQQSAQASAEFVLRKLEKSSGLRRQLESKGVLIETIEGGEPIHVMQHLGERHGHQSVVWRAGCWGERGVKAITEGAFQWVSAHLTVHASGGQFWQLMIAENAVQAACGPRSKVKIFADQEDMSLEYCDGTDCTQTMDGRPVRHVRLDCRVALVDENRPREFVTVKMQRMNRKLLLEEAPWFL